jgi:hypothetical protein
LLGFTVGPGRLRSALVNGCAPLKSLSAGDD